MKLQPLFAFSWISALLTVVCSAAEPKTHQPDDLRPNILWIIVDDMSAEFSCYGETLINTPNVDELASRGLKFNHAFVTAPVCSTCRSALITGMYQTSIGAHHHRSGRGMEKITLPDGVRPIPQLFQEAGYYTSISGWPIAKKKLGKTDYNFEWNPQMYDGADWSDREPGQPFFAQIQTPGGKLRGSTPEAAQKTAAQAGQLFGNHVNPADVQLPPYYPRDEVILEDWAAYLDSIRLTDHMVGEVVQKLRNDGDLENTVILFMTDHGISHARGKQFLYEEGIHVPLVIAGPKVEQGERNDLVEHIDIAALSLGLAGIEVPKTMQAKNILASDYQPRDAIFAARDRCDETVDYLRCVRTDRFKYIRNGYPMRSHMQPCAYKDAKSIVRVLRSLHSSGKLDEIQSRIFAATRPAEELYDLKADPHEIRNLADDPKFASTLMQMRERLDRWQIETNDQGREPESAKAFDSDMHVYLNAIRRRNPDSEHLRQIEQNIQWMKEQAAQSK